MVLACPQCGMPHRLAGRPSGAKFRCRCGHLLAAPLSAEHPRISLFGMLGVGAALALAVGLPVLAAAVLPDVSVFEGRARLSEAKPNLLALCEAVSAERARSGEWVTAGPIPLVPPAGAHPRAFVPSPAFQRLGFTPSQVRLSYEVQADDAGVRCLARGDLNGDGRTSRFTVPIGPDGGLLPLWVEDEAE